MAPNTAKGWLPRCDAAHPATCPRSQHRILMSFTALLSHSAPKRVGRHVQNGLDVGARLGSRTCSAATCRPRPSRPCGGPRSWPTWTARPAAPPTWPTSWWPRCWAPPAPRRPGAPTWPARRALCGAGRPRARARRCRGSWRRLRGSGRRPRWGSGTSARPSLSSVGAAARGKR